MKVIQILYSGIGGNASVAFSLIEGDIYKKWKSSFIFLGVERLFSGFKKKCNDLDIKCFNYSNTENYILREIYVIKILIKEKPDVVISHNFNIFSLILAKCFLKIKVLYIEHTPYAYRDLKNKIVDFFIYIFFDKIIYLNKSYKERLLKNKYYNFFRKKIIFINNGVSSPKKIKIKKFKRNEIKLGMLSRFSKGKRQDLLIKAVYELKKKLPKTKIKLELVGDGDNLKRSKKIVSDLGLTDNIFFKKKIKYQEIYNWLNQIDIYTHISTDEGLSTAILMAMAYKKPIIATDNFGNRFLKNKKNLNAILTNNQLDIIINSVISLIKNSSKREIIKKNSFNLFNKKFSSEIMFKNYENEINNI